MQTLLDSAKVALNILTVEEWTALLTAVMLALTVLMVVLTVAIAALTVAVVVYARKTLQSTQESLDFFAKPLVSLRLRPRDYCWSMDNFSSRTSIDGVFELHNDSALPIFIEEKGAVTINLIQVRCDQTLSDLTCQPENFGPGRNPDDSQWPGPVHQRLPIVFTVSYPVRPRDKRHSCTLCLEFAVKYRYRGRVYVVSKQQVLEVKGSP